MVTAYYIITNSGYAVQYCILYHVQGYAVCYCLLYHHKAPSRHIKHTGIHSQVCFHRWLFMTLLNHEDELQGLLSQWMALIRICVLPNCSQWLLDLACGLLDWDCLCHLLNTQYTTAVCVLMAGLTHFGLLTLPHHPHHLPPACPPPYTCHSWYYSCCEKSYSKSSSVSQLAEIVIRTVRSKYNVSSVTTV